MQDQKGRIVLQHTIRDFFREVVSTAIHNQRLQTHELAVAYLADLLSEFARAEKLHDQREGAMCDEPLAAQVLRALQAAPDQRISLLRRLGDACLFVSGFFADSFNRKLVDVDYYKGMGEGCYANVSATLKVRHGADGFTALYDELAGKFTRFVDVFAEVSEQSQLATNQGTLRLYEKWMRTDSERMRRELVERGVMPNESARTKLIH
jgi:hypothetical protein